MKKFNITICHTSDMHGYVMPYTYANNEPAETGMSKIASLTNKIENKIMIDTGDLLQGSALATYIANNRENISPFSQILNDMNYDYFIPGNHDFNYGDDYLYGLTDNLNATVLSANIYKNNRVFKPYEIIEFDDLKIAIIGLTTHYIPNWENPKNIEGYTFKHELEELDSILKELPEVDYKIVAYHGGFNKDLETDELNPNETGENSGSDMFDRDINCLLTGHQHQRVAGVKNGVVYSQPGCNGNQFNQIELKFYYDNGWKVNESIKQVVVGENFEQSITDIVKTEEKKTQEWLDVPIGTLKDGDCLITDPLEARLNKSPLVTLINQAQLELTKADISCTSLGNDVKGFNQSITTRDIVSTYIYPNTLVVLEVSGHVLKEALEKNAEFFTYNGSIKISDNYMYPKKELYNYDMFDGIEYSINLSNPIGERVTSITKNNEPLDLDNNYSLVMNNYRAAGGGNFTMFKNAKTLQTIEKDMVEILCDYISKEKVVSLNTENNITITY